MTRAGFSSLIFAIKLSNGRKLSLSKRGRVSPITANSKSVAWTGMDTSVTTIREARHTFITFPIRRIHAFGKQKGRAETGSQQAAVERRGSRIKSNRRTSEGRRRRPEVGWHPPSSVFAVASPGQVRFPATFYFGAASRPGKAGRIHLSSSALSGVKKRSRGLRGSRLD